MQSVWMACGDDLHKRASQRVREREREVWESVSAEGRKIQFAYALANRNCELKSASEAKAS